MLTPEQWRYRHRIEVLAAVGCLLFLAAWVAVFIYEFSLASLLAVGVALLAAAPSYLLTKAKRFQQTERLLSEHDLSYPAHVLVLRPVTDLSGLSGGHLII